LQQRIIFLAVSALSESAVAFLTGCARPWLLAASAMLLVLGGEQLIEHFARQSALERERRDVLYRLADLSVRLRGEIVSNLFLVHGLTAVIGAKPGMDQTEFAAIAQGLVDKRHALHNIAGAPDMVIRLMYPMAGNEAALGLDYRSHPTQRESALRARDSGESVLAGPLTLQQGGVGIIVREPVFMPPERTGGEPRFWGLVSSVIDAETLYAKAGLHAPDLGLRIALGNEGSPVFFGDAGVLKQQPVTLQVVLPGTTWQLAALPAKGWGQVAPELGLIRLMSLLAALLAGVMAYRLGRSNQALAISNTRLNTLLDTLPDLVWLKDPQGVYLACNPRFEAFYGAHQADILGKTDHDFAPAELADFFRTNDLAAIAAGKARSNEEWLTFASDGHREYAETIKTPMYDADGRLLGVLGIARNITERTRSEQQIRGLNRLYQVLSGINEAIVRLRESDALFREACRIAVERGGFRMAWLGLADPGSGEVLPVAHAGVVEGYLDALHISLGDDEHSHGPTGVALHEGRHVVCNDIARDPRMAPWRTAALQRGYRASAAFPIQVGGRVIGTFNLYADSADLFDAVELRLLDELALDLGFALEFIEAETELHHQRDLLDRTSRLAQVGGWWFDVATHSGGWSEETARIHDLEPSATVSVSAGLGFLSTESRQRAEQAIKAAIERGEPYELELQLTSAKGVDKWVRTLGLPVLEDGHVVRLEGAIQDISKRKLAELQARQSELVLDSVFQALPDLFFLMDADGSIRDYRASRDADLYVAAENFIGKRMQDVLPPAAATQFSQGMERVRQGGGLATCEYDLTLPQGLRHFEARLNLLPGTDRFVVVVRDISERKHMEDALGRLNAELELRVQQRTAELTAVNKEMETFTYSVSHDLKAPLRGIDGYSRLLQEEYAADLNDEGRLFLANVRHGVEQMGQLIEDLLAYSRMERRNLNGMPLDLAEQVARVLAERREDIAAHGLQVDTALADISVRADPDGLALVLRNLIDNALKFTRDSQPPRLTLRANANEKTATLEIADNGIGFDMQFHDRIFEIFQRLQRAEDFPGTGVGLAIVRKAMQRMGGRVWAESKPGCGATFFLELPR
jgi:PAS domain S-box-containing protein